MMIRVLGICLGLFIAIGSIRAQDVQVRGGFLADSLAIGDEGGYFLTARYPKELNILFPDSTYNFAPFEYVRKVYFPTKTTNNESYDSAVYYLSTFEIEKLQSLSLNVFQFNDLDTVTYASPRDTVRLIELVRNLPDTLAVQNLPLKTNTAYQLVPFLFNYPILMIVLGVLLVLALVGWLVFGKRIRKHYRIKRMQKAYEKFSGVYATQVNEIRQSFSPARAEHALVEWKRYMEQLESRPYTKLTARETMRMENNEKLGSNLHNVDGAIYGHNTSVVEPLEHLMSFARERYTKKLEEVKHG
ncbi:MAG: hypothetical protein QM762_10050 [Chryseolinea sp.]